MNGDEVEVHKLAKKRTRPISSHFDQTNLVNKGFNIWLLVKFCSRDTAGSPERARWLHLARSGSQSQRAIWFILPAHGASHIIRWIITPDSRPRAFYLTIGPLQDPVTWYGINYTGTRMTQWDFQNKGTRTSPARLSFVLKVPLRHLRPSVIYSVPCDWILQRAY